jgi:hypothetical protein
LLEVEINLVSAPIVGRTSEHGIDPRVSPLRVRNELAINILGLDVSDVIIPAKV